MTRRMTVLAMCGALAMAGCGDGRVNPVGLAPQKAAELYIDGLRNKRLETVFDLLPPSFQRDANELLVAFASRMDEPLWNEARTLLQRVGSTLKTKKSLLIGSDLVSSMTHDPNVSSEEVSKAYDAAVELLDLLARGAITDLTVLRKGDLRSILAKDGAALMNAVSSGVGRAVGFEGETANPLDELAKITFKTETESQDRATLSVLVDNALQETVELVKVDGVWVLADVANGWQRMMQDAREAIAQIDFSSSEQRMGVRMVLGMLDGIVTQLEKAKTSEDVAKAFNIFGMNMGL